MKKLLVLIILLLTPITTFAYTVTTGVSGTTGLSDFGELGWRDEAATPFTTSAAGTVSSISVCLLKVGAPSDNVVVAIQTDSSDNPSDVDVGSGTIAGTTLTTSGTQYNINFSGALSLNASTQYWIDFRRSGALDASNYYVYCGSNTAGINSSKKYLGTWTRDSLYDTYTTFTVTEPSTAQPSFGILTLFGF